MLKEYTCEYCKIKFSRYTYKSDARYCSLKCYHQTLKDNATFNESGYHKNYYENNKEKLKKQMKEFYLKNPEAKRLNKIRARCHRYGITIEEYNKQYEKQNGCCAICGANDKDLPKKLHIDHNHTDNKFRGFLCHYCNTALGLFRDDVVVLRKAIKYLKN